MTFLTKLIGGALIAGGLIMVFAFPDISDYQYSSFSHAGILIGIVLIGIGIALLVM